MNLQIFLFFDRGKMEENQSFGGLQIMAKMQTFNIEEAESNWLIF
jgi:hypothetical protein